jgi:hypothetical protein
LQAFCFSFADEEIVGTASSFNSRLRFLPGQRLMLQQLLKHSFSKRSEQMWHGLSLGKFALLIRTSHSLRSGLFFKGSRWKLIPLLESLSVLFEQPTTAHSTILELMLSSELLKFARFSHVHSDVMLCAQAFNMASKMADVQIVLGRSFLLLQ